MSTEPKNHFRRNPGIVRKLARKQGMTEEKYLESVKRTEKALLEELDNSGK
jgi:hypothetical protein